MLRVLSHCIPLPLLLLLTALPMAPAAETKPPAKPVFRSKLVTSDTPGHAVQIDIELGDAQRLYLVVTDGGNGFGCDWADWAEPRLIGPQGEKKLTELEWKSATAAWGQVRVDANAEGRPMRIQGRDVAYGIGTHANSLIVYDVPPGHTRFKARAGLDNGGTDQADGRSTSVEFLIYLEKPPAFVLAGSSGGPQGGHEAEQALENLDTAEGLETTLFACEPMIRSLTNMDIDHRGRIWVCDVINYRGRRGTRPEGDRIVILEDTDGDGVADHSKVYYQGTDIDAALGICVLGNRVIVTCSPNVFVFIDDDGDDRPDRREVLFTKIGGEQNDHGAHAFIFGPDGRFYWNVGNAGSPVHDRDGEPVVDLAGNVVNNSGQPYRQGMVFRCNPDGSDFEVLGHNFRNDYEVAVDSFGTIWQSDNDDDGNRGCRIVNVMEYGNFGYTEEFSGAGWKSPRTGMSDDVPTRHWHQNDPGVVPNVLQYGAGSPAGICVNEGRGLPEVFRNQMIHAEAGPNAVRAYPVQLAGAGYTAQIEPILTGTRDKWFRPIDACIAPDGSLFVADWYDPGVGGNGMGDIDRGRVFRVSLPNTRYHSPSFDFTTPGGAVEALKNPNLSVRYLAWTALNEMGQEAEPALVELWRSDDPRHRARAVWLLGRIEGRAQQTVDEALADADGNLRVTGLRLARQLKLDLIPLVRRLLDDPSALVRREAAIALRHNESPETAGLWAELASRHDGADRWYLEALGIAAEGRCDACLRAWLAAVGDDWNTPAGRAIVWRSRAEKTAEYLTRIVRDPATPAEELPRYLRAFDFQSPETRNAALAELAFRYESTDAERQTFVQREAIGRLSRSDVEGRADGRVVLDRVLDEVRGTSEYLDLVDRFHLTDRSAELLAMAEENVYDARSVRAARLLLAWGETEGFRQAFERQDVESAVRVALLLGNSADGRAKEILRPLLEDAEPPLDLRGQAVKSIAKDRNGALELIELVDSNRLAPELRPFAALALHKANWDEIRDEAARLFPLPPAKDRALPPVRELMKMRGAVERGKPVFHGEGTCSKCHQVNGEGDEIGPDLSEIGTKLGREALFESVVFPSAGINFNYETYVIETDDGNLLTGVITSETDEALTLSSADYVVRVLKRSEIVEQARQAISLMPADVTKTITDQELVDIVQYMTTLKQAEGQ